MSVQYKFLVSVMTGMMIAANALAWDDSWAWGTNWPTLAELTNTTEETSWHGPWVWSSWSSQCWHAVYARLNMTGYQYKDIDEIGHDEGMIFRWDQHIYETATSDQQHWYYDDSGQTNSAVWNNYWYLKSNPGEWTNSGVVNGCFARFPCGLKDAMGGSLWGRTPDLSVYPGNDKGALAWTDSAYLDDLDGSTSTPTAGLYGSREYIEGLSSPPSDATNYMMDDLFRAIGIPTNFLYDPRSVLLDGGKMFPLSPPGPYWSFSGYPFNTTSIGTNQQVIATNAYTHGDFGIGAYSYPSLRWVLTNMTTCWDTDINWEYCHYQVNAAVTDTWENLLATCHSNWVVDESGTTTYSGVGIPGYRSYNWKPVRMFFRAWSVTNEDGDIESWHMDDVFSDTARPIPWCGWEMRTNFVVGAGTATVTHTISTFLRPNTNTWTAQDPYTTYAMWSNHPVETWTKVVEASGGPPTHSWMGCSNATDFLAAIGTNKPPPGAEIRLGGQSEARVFLSLPATQ